MIDFVDTEKPLVESDFIYVERRLGLVLPSQLKSHYAKFNGGSPKKCVLNTNDSLYVVNQFLPIKYGAAGQRLEDVYTTLNVSESALPKNLVAFALDPGGDFFCIDVDATGLEAVYMCRSDYFDDPSRACEFLADSFDSFVGKLRDDEA